MLQVDKATTGIYLGGSRSEGLNVSTVRTKHWPKES